MSSGQPIGCTRWRRCSEAQGPPAPLVLATRADDRADGTGGGSASQLWCGPKCTERSPKGTEDRQCSWDGAGSPEGSRAAGSSHDRLRGCPGTCPLLTGAGGHCSRSSGRPHGEVPPPGCAHEEEGGEGEGTLGGVAAC